MKRLLLGLPLLFAVPTLLAQDRSADEAAGAAAGLAGVGCTCIIALVALAIQIAIAVWVYRDAKNRGMDNAVLLTILTILTGLLGLLIYLLMRPKGNLVACPSCQKKRLEGSAKCPHCGNP
ncbi:MAG: hypothetical protein ABR589_12630 [Chthoniobacterales bacterium]